MSRHFPHWIKAYCQYTVASEAPLDFHFWTAVSTVAACLRRRVWKDELDFRWTPNFYIIFVGPAGVVKKSTTLNIGYELLRKVDGVMFGPDSMTWHGLAKRFEAAVEYAKYSVNGSAKEVLMSPLTCSISELGTFLRTDDAALVSFLTDVWDGKERPFEHQTKDSGNIKIENAWLNVIGATTPEWIQDNFPASMLTQGLGSRVIFVYSESPRGAIAYPSRVVRPTDHTETRRKLIEDLQVISKLIGPYELTEEAYVWGEEWYKRNRDTRSTHLASGRYSGYLARKQTHIHKLAMVLAASQRDELTIERDDLIVAEKALEGTEHSMIKVFENVGLVDEAKHVAEIVGFVRVYRWISAPDLYRLCYNIMAKRDFEGALRIAVEGDLLEIALKDGKKGLKPKGATLQ